MNKNVDIRAINEKIEKESAFVDLLTLEMNKVIIGQKHMVERLLIGLLGRGHILLEGVPGLAKTLAINTLSQSVKGVFSRIQFTPDLLPADVVGTMIYNIKENDFTIKKGPIFANFVLADEINRASPRTQSALLQAMQEKMVSVAGEDRALIAPFHVLATQNPIEQEGTYPLPEAQLDRFLVQINVPYPDRQTERDILIATTGVTEDEAHAVFTTDELLAAQTVLRRMPVGDSVVEMILDLVRAFRPDEPDASARVKDTVAWGPGPRAAQALMLTVRAKALLDGRLAPSPEDVIDMAEPVLGHRMALNFAARARGDNLADLIRETASHITSTQASAA